MDSLVQLGELIIATLACILVAIVWGWGWYGVMCLLGLANSGDARDPWASGGCFGCAVLAVGIGLTAVGAWIWTAVSH